MLNPVTSSTERKDSWSSAKLDDATPVIYSNYVISIQSDYRITGIHNHVSTHVATSRLNDNHTYCKMSGSLGTHESLVNKPLWPEDTVEYRLYLADEKLEFLNTLAVDCTHFARSLLRGHLWNYGGFALAQWKEGEIPAAFIICIFFIPNEYRLLAGTSYPAHLYGRTCFHDNIEDEWLIVHLLFALSKSNAELIIRYAKFRTLDVQTDIVIFSSISILKATMERFVA